jgi:hypothetical protein
VSLSRPTLALAVLIIGSSGALAAESDADKAWLMDQNGCKLVEPDSARGVVLKPVWEGECIDGFLGGQGTLKLGPITYTGEFKRGQIVTGELLFREMTFKGEFIDNTPSRGTAKYGGTTITGVFDKEGNILGPVVADFSDGSHYEGDYDKSRGKHGKGRHTKADGDVYEGEFQNDARHGTGKWVGASGWTYTGHYAFGYRDGRGIEVFQDGSSYDGEYKHGDRSGQGRLVEANGAVREGEWQGDKLHGNCKIQEAAGDKYEGSCVMGKPSGHGHLERVADEAVYEGEFLDGVFHGQGRVQAPGYAYEGAFALGMKSGRGKEVFDTGEQYEGEFVRNERSGQGLLRIADPNGALTYEGTFKKGMFAGQGTLTIGEQSFKGEFKQGEFIRGVMHTKQGKTIEIDAEKETYLEVLKDGTKVPVDPGELALPPEA